MLKTIKIITGSLFVVTMAGCAAGEDNTGIEYAPQMYHSTPYEPLSQVTDKESGTWLDSNEEDEHGEFYNSNPYNNHGMTMRNPAENTIKRGTFLAANNIAPDDYATAEAQLENPFGEEVVKEGRALYERFCEHCHGSKGLGDGKVGQVFKGVTAYTSVTVKDKKAGHIYWVITHGKGRMGAHGSQLSPEERWKIVSYVQTLQQQ